MSLLEQFLKDLYTFLTGKDALDNNIVRKHNRKLETLGDVSFPLHINSWHRLLPEQSHSHKTILDKSSELNNTPVNFNTLTTQKWALQIKQCIDIKNNCHVFINRETAFKQAVQQVVRDENKFGAFDLNLELHTRIDGEKKLDELNLTELRIKITSDVVNNLLLFNGCNLSTSDSILITNKSFIVDNNAKTIVCGAVLSAKGCKDVATTAEDFYGQRAIDMRLMAEHKYGMRITSKPGWQDFFKKLGDAAVTIELLQNKPTHTTTLDVNNHYVKNASFILYNCARLATLFKEFDRKVGEGLYPVLPDLEEIDFNLLVQPEEWELLYVYILQFPLMIKSCINDVAQCRINVHNLISFLTTMASLFSVYYRRVRILTDPRPHLFPVLYARIYLLKALYQVLKNSLGLLNIEPTKQM